MRLWIFAVSALLAACASPTPQEQTAGASPPVYTDARSSATDAEIRDARRAYRSACQEHAPADYCECMTAGMAQVLAPADLRVATAILTGTGGSTSSDARARAEAARAQVNAGCAQYRG